MVPQSSGGDLRSFLVYAGTPQLTNRFESGFATPARVSPSFGFACNPGDSPPAPALFRPLDTVSISARRKAQTAARENELRDHLELGPDPPGPPPRPSKTIGFGWPWGGFHGDPRLKALSSLQTWAFPWDSGELAGPRKVDYRDERVGSVGESFFTEKCSDPSVLL